MTADNEQERRTRRQLYVRLENVTTEQPKTVWQHPVAKALGAFLLTTVVGTILTTCWQTRQWTEQQEYTARVDRAKAQLEITKELTQKVMDAFSTSNQVIFLTLLEAKGTSARRIRDQQLRSAIEDWLKQNRSWRIDEATLLAETNAYFECDTVRKLVTEVLKNRYNLFIKVREFLEVSQALPAPPAGTQKRAKMLKINQEIFLLIRDTISTDLQNPPSPTTSGALPRLTAAMIKESRQTQLLQKPLWRQLLGM